MDDKLIENLIEDETRRQLSGIELIASENYVSDDIYELGIVEIETPNGNKVRVYDKERCICDIIRSKGRMDSEQVKKTIKQYMQSRDKDIAKLSEYSKKIGINKKVMEMVGGFYE